MRRSAFIGMGLMLVLGAGEVSMAVESPAYRVEFEQKPFEIRRYPALVEATVQVSGTRDAAVSAGFRLLANYIFGGNQRDAKIAMTAPVLQTPAEKLAVAADPAQVHAWYVSFIMPSGTDLAALPPARSPRIQFSTVPARRMAVIGFSGRWTDANLASHQALLRAFLEQHHLQPLSGPLYAFYDPPWTPWFWRTNEVQYPIAD